MMRRPRFLVNARRVEGGVCFFLVGVKPFPSVSGTQIRQGEQMVISAAGVLNVLTRSTSDTTAEPSGIGRI